MQVQPYLFFDGRCEEAIEFYRKALGAEVTMLMRFKDSPEPPPPGMYPPGSENKVMHASFRIGDATVMASDGTARASRRSRAFRSRSRAPTRPRPTGCSPPWPMADRCRCRWPRPSSRRASAWSPTASAWAGWSSWRLETGSALRYPANRSTATGGRSRDRACQASPASALTHSPPVVEAIASVWPSSATSSAWR